MGEQDLARALRKRMTGSERLVWNNLRKRKTGFHFRRQHPIAGYVLDFYCARCLLCVEIDGIGHDPQRDRERDSVLAELGIKTLRFSNFDVSTDWPTCQDQLLRVCLARSLDIPPPDLEDEEIENPET